jgi:hypothetical protein
MVTEDTTLTRRWNLVCFFACLFRTTQCTGYADCVKPLPTEDLDLVLEHTLPLWEHARGRHVFISGGTGFFGAWLLESLAYCNRKLTLGLSATVLSRDPGAFARRMPHLASEPSIQMLQGDVRDFAFPQEEFEYVIHAAAPTSTAAAGQPLELLSTLLDGTKHMLACAKARGAKRFLLTSSGAVYGRQPQSVGHIPEDYLGGPAWLDPNAVYAEGKRVSEQMCSLYARESGIDFMHRSMLCLCWSAPAAKPALRNRQLYRGRSGGQEHCSPGRRHAHALLSLRSRSRDLAMDDAVA